MDFNGKALEGSSTTLTVACPRYLVGPPRTSSLPASFHVGFTR